MGISLAELKKRAAFLRTVHLLTFHCLVEVDGMSVEFRAVHAGKFNLVADCNTARPPFILR